MLPDYLGDAVYVKVEHGDLVLWTSDGETTTNEIVLDDYTWRALLRYVKRWEDERLEEGPKP